MLPWDRSQPQGRRRTSKRKKKKKRKKERIKGWVESLPPERIIHFHTVPHSIKGNGAWDYKRNHKCLPHPKIKVGQKIFSLFFKKKTQNHLGGSWTHYWNSLQRHKLLNDLFSAEREKQSGPLERERQSRPLLRGWEAVLRCRVWIESAVAVRSVLPPSGLGLVTTTSWGWPEKENFQLPNLKQENSSQRLSSL